MSQHPDTVAGMGAWLSSHTLAITEVTERASLPWVTIAWADSVTKRGFKYVADVSAPASKLVSDSLTRLLELAEKNTGKRPKKIGLIYDNTAYSLSFIKPMDSDNIEIPGWGASGSKCHKGVSRSSLSTDPNG